MGEGRREAREGERNPLLPESELSLLEQEKPEKMAELGSWGPQQPPHSACRACSFCSTAQFKSVGLKGCVTLLVTVSMEELTSHLRLLPRALS